MNRAIVPSRLRVLASRGVPGVRRRAARAARRSSPTRLTLKSVSVRLRLATRSRCRRTPVASAAVEIRRRSLVRRRAARPGDRPSRGSRSARAPSRCRPATRRSRRGPRPRAGRTGRCGRPAAPGCREASNASSRARVGDLARARGPRCRGTARPRRASAVDRPGDRVGLGRARRRSRPRSTTDGPIARGAGPSPWGAAPGSSGRTRWPAARSPGGSPVGQQIGTGVTSSYRSAKVDDVAHVGAAPLVDRLVVVADDARGRRRRRPGEQLDQPLLGRVDVLVLVDDQVAQLGGDLGVRPPGRSSCSHRPHDLRAEGHEAGSARASRSSARATVRKSPSGRSPASSSSFSTTSTLLQERARSPRTACSLGSQLLEPEPVRLARQEGWSAGSRRAAS